MKEEVLSSVWGRAFLPGQAARAGFREDLVGFCLANPHLL